MWMEGNSVWVFIVGMGALMCLASFLIGFFWTRTLRNELAASLERRYELVDALNESGEMIRKEREDAEKARNKAYLNGVNDAMSKAEFRKLDHEAGISANIRAAQLKEIEANEAIARHTADYETKATAIYQEIAALSLPVYPTDEAFYAMSDAHRQEVESAYFNEAQAYRDKVTALSQKQSRFRSALDENIIITLKKYALIEKAITYEQHSFWVAEKLAMMDDSPGLPILREKDKPYEADPYWEAMHGKELKKVSTVETAENLQDIVRAIYDESRTVEVQP